MNVNNGWHFSSYYSVDNLRIQPNIWSANATDAIFHCGPLSTWKCTKKICTKCNICGLNFVSVAVDIKFFGQNSALVKAVNADASWRFSPETYFRAPARLKICSLLPPCHQNPLWKAHSCNLCRNDAENFPSKPFCWRARFTCWTLAYMR